MTPERLQSRLTISDSLLKRFVRTRQILLIPYYSFRYIQKFSNDFLANNQSLDNRDGIRCDPVKSNCLKCKWNIINFGVARIRVYSILKDDKVTEGKFMVTGKRMTGRIFMTFLAMGPLFSRLAPSAAS
jgi:hypothetical protein